MAISLTTDGLRLDYRTTIQTSASGKYPIGTVIAVGADSTFTLPGTWVWIDSAMGHLISSAIGASVTNGTVATRIA